MIDITDFGYIDTCVLRDCAFVVDDNVCAAPKAMIESRECWPVRWSAVLGYINRHCRDRDGEEQESFEVHVDSDDVRGVQTILGRQRER